MFKNCKGQKVLFVIFILVIMFTISTGKINFNKYITITSLSDYNLIKKNIIDPDSIIYLLSGVKPRIPMTYLKKVIPLLTYYNPDSMESNQEVIYNSDPEYEGKKNNIIKLKFDLSKENVDSKKTPVKPERNENNRPLVAIYHTHTSETYMDDPRPQDNNGHVKPGEAGNIAQAGRELARVLASKYDIQVIHTTRVHDESYSHSYLNSRNTVKALLKEHKNIDLLIDLHRDGIKKAERDNLVTTISKKRSAKIMPVVTNGKFEFAHLDLESNPHTEWKQNLDLAEQLADKMEKIYPGLLRRIEVKDTIYNQDLHPNLILIELGDYRNTTSEALQASRLLADVIAELLTQ
ncbi:MAG: stage II sporulation protein P [Halanaerobiales bacterium]